MKRAAFVCAAIVLCAFTTFALESSQRPCSVVKNLDEIKAKALETAEVKLDANQLKLAGSFLKGKDSNEAMIQKLAANLRNICVVSFKFDQEEKYSKGEIESMRKQFSFSGWSQMVALDNKQKKETVDVFMRMNKDAFDGISLIAAKPKELVFVQIDGSIDIQQLMQLGGNFGIPNLNMIMPKIPGVPTPQK
jgi:hypothetical protein